MTEAIDMVQGVVIQDLRVISDDRGAVLHMMRCDSPLFTRFGEIYFSEVNPGQVKAWKLHAEMTQRFAVPVGRLRFAIFDQRPDSGTFGNVMFVELGRPDAYRLLLIPPGLWYGFGNPAEGPSVLANCADLPHAPAESHQVPATSPGFPSCWPA